jgi:translation initiation factor IF-1
MKREDNLEVGGVVIQALPNTTFMVQIDEDAPEDYANKEVLCTLRGKMKLYKIRVMPGDSVKVEITPYDPTKGRITYREK